LLIAACMALAWAAPARAYYLWLSGGTAGAIPAGATNNFISSGSFPGPALGGYFGARLVVQVPAGTALDGLQVEFFGAEAGFHNEFNLDGTELFDHAGGLNIAPDLASPLGSYFTTAVAPGALPFGFDVNNDAASVLNGANPVDDAPNFFASCIGTSGRYCDSVYLFLDDGGAGPDADYDDFLVRITVTGAVVVPEPGTLALLAFALFGVVIVLRRNRR
jgi:hypothetical protein